MYFLIFNYMQWLIKRLLIAITIFKITLEEINYFKNYFIIFTLLRLILEVQLFYHKEMKLCLLVHILRNIFLNRLRIDDFKFKEDKGNIFFFFTFIYCPWYIFYKKTKFLIKWSCHDLKNNVKSNTFAYTQRHTHVLYTCFYLFTPFVNPPSNPRIQIQSPSH